MHPELVRAARLSVDTEIASLYSNCDSKAMQYDKWAAVRDWTKRIVPRLPVPRHHPSSLRAITPAIRAAERAGVPFEILRYDHDPAARSYGLEAAEALGVAPGSVFKTLVVVTDAGRLAVALVPVDRSLDLKAVADALGARRAALAPTADAERATGYVVGGISPLGQRRRLPTVIDVSALDLQRVHVSAGRRGLEIALDPAELVRLCEATTAAIARE